MKNRDASLSTEICEQHLKDRKEYNNSHGILPSENVVIDRILQNSDEMQPVYAELVEKLQRRHPPAIAVYLDLLLSTAMLYHPARTKEAREIQRALTDLNFAISKAAEHLADLLKRRSVLGNTSAFFSDSHSHICDVIEGASRQNYHYKTHLHERLRALSGRYDGKYWPTLEGIVTEIGLNSESAHVEAVNSWAREATCTKRASPRDFLRALNNAVSEQTESSFGAFPTGFKLTDRATASIVNSVLEIDPDEVWSDEKVKRFNQGERARAEQ